MFEMGTLFFFTSFLEFFVSIVFFIYGCAYEMISYHKKFEVWYSEWSSQGFGAPGAAYVWADFFSSSFLGFFVIISFFTYGWADKITSWL